MTKQLVAIHAIQHKPKTRKETVAPGQTFTPKDDEERAFFLRTKAARELTEEEAARASAGAKKATTGKKPTTGKKAASAAPAPDTEKAVTMDSEPGTTSSDDGMLD
jgi:hypothetical protein